MNESSPDRASCAHTHPGCIDNVAGNQARLAVLIASDVAGDSVNEHTELSRLEGGQLLRDQRSNHAGEHVARAAGGHARVAGCIHVEPPSIGDHA